MEHTYYQDANCCVTTARVMLPGATYALSQITSVRLVKHALGPWSWLWSGAATLMGLVFLAACFGATVKEEYERAGAYIFWSIMVGGIGLVRLLTIPLATRWQVLLGTSSGEVVALSTKSRPTADNMMGAVNHAIVNRG